MDHFLSGGYKDIWLLLREAPMFGVYISTCFSLHVDFFPAGPNVIYFVSLLQSAKNPNSSMGNSLLVFDAASKQKLGHSHTFGC